MAQIVEKFAHSLKKLKIKQNQGKPAPNKPCLLLAVFDQFETTEKIENKFRYEPRLLARFDRYYQVCGQRGERRSVSHPYIRLIKDGFWHVYDKSGNSLEQLDNSDIDKLADKGSKITEFVGYASFDSDYFECLKNRNIRNQLRCVLIKKWLPELEGEIGNVIREVQGAPDEITSITQSPNNRIENGIDDVVGSEIGRLSERERNVLTLRYGLQGNAVHTLQELGDLQGCSRERIRQIQSKSIRNLRKSQCKHIFREYLMSQCPQIWHCLSDGKAFILASGLKENQNRLSNELLFAIEVTFGSLKKYLSEVGNHIRGGWSFYEVSHTSISKILQPVVDHLNANSGIYETTVLGSHFGINVDIIEFAPAVSKQINIYDNFIFTGYFSPRKRRTIYLHKILSESPVPFIDLWILRKRYLDMCSDDHCTYRDLQICLETNKNLFLRIYDNYWTALPLNLHDISTANIGTADYKHTWDELEQRDGTGQLSGLAKFLWEHIFEYGPQSLKELQEACAKKDALWNKNSVIPTMFASGQFVRVLPGIFGIIEHVRSYRNSEKMLDVMKNDDRINQYVMARRAGEPSDWYVGWGFHLEYELVLWSRKHASQATYCIGFYLMCVSTPNKIIELSCVPQPYGESIFRSGPMQRFWNQSATICE